jgi:hypothetical protein
MELNTAHYHLKLEQPELMRIASWGMDKLKRNARRAQKLHNYNQYCEYASEDIKLIRQAYRIAGELQTFELHMDEIEGYFNNEKTKLNRVPNCT